MENFVHRPEVYSFKNANVLYPPAPISDSATSNSNLPAITQRSPYSVDHPSRIKSVVKAQKIQVVPYAKYRVVRKYSGCTKSVFVAKALYHRILFKK